MKARVIGLIPVVAIAGVVAFSLPNGADNYLKLDRMKRAGTPAGVARDVMKNARNTRLTPVNANLMIRRVAPGAPEGPTDLYHQPWDWAEVYNRSERSIPLEGYSLSDDPDQVRKYRFPSIVIPPRSACRVWLSGFVSMNSIWSLTPTDAQGGKGWKPARNESLADRFTYMWLGFRAPDKRLNHDPFDYRLEWPLQIAKPGRYGVWLQAEVHAGASSRLQVWFQGQTFDLEWQDPKRLSFVQLRNGGAEDGCWELLSGRHWIHCKVLEGDTLVSQVAVLRQGEPFGAGAQDLHAGFKLKQSGEFIGLFDPDGVAVDHVTTPALETGTMAVRDPEGRKPLEIVPVVSGEGGSSLPSQPRFDVPGGMVKSGTEVEITCDDPTAVIRYTLNGARPVSTSETVVGKISMTSNTVLRARAFDGEGRAGRVVEATYWTDQVNDLPVLSAIVEPEHLYNHSRGILYNTSIRGLLSERRCHLTLIETNGLTSASVGGMRIQGRSSRRTPTKRNFRFIFRERYGQPFWPGVIFEGEEAHRISSVVATGRNVVRSQLAHELMDLARVRSPRRKAVRLFVNGKPFGLYLLMEEVDDPAYLKRLFGHLDLDVIKEKTFEPVKRGNRSRFDAELRSTPILERASIPREDLSRLFDIDQLCRWLAVVEYAGIEDNGQGYFVRDNRAEGPFWTPINWDFDHAFTVPLEQGLPKAQGQRALLLRVVRNAITESGKADFPPARQELLNHIAPLFHLSERTRELMGRAEPYLAEEFEAHVNQRCFVKETPTRPSFMAMHYYQRWEQLLLFADTRNEDFARVYGHERSAWPAHTVRIEGAELVPDLLFDSYPARAGYVGHYYEGTELSVNWKDPQAARRLEFEINGIPHRSTALRTNVTEDLVIRIRD